MRFFPGEWYDHILIRAAKHERDFTGGMNQYASLNTLHTAALRIAADFTEKVAAMKEKPEQLALL